MKIKILNILVTLLVIVSLCACESTKAFLASPAGQTTEKVALNILLSAASAYANNGKIDVAWAVPVALNSLATVATSNMSNQQAATAIQNTVTNFSNDSTTRSVAKKLASAFVAANPQTPQARTDTIVALASGASNGLAISTLP